MQPKGKLLIIGGAEDRHDSEKNEMAGENENYERFEIFKDLRSSTKGGIEIISAASSEPEEMEELCLKTFKDIGFEDIRFLHISKKGQADAQEYCDRINRAKTIFFTGGDQAKFSSLIIDTALAKTITEKYRKDEDFIVAGTSAGAMVMSAVMLGESGTKEALLGSELKIEKGLELLYNCIIDTHFIKRGRFSRLAHAVILKRGYLGLGLGEDTALVIHDGYLAECRGSGTVTIIDGAAIQQTNIDHADAHCPIYAENLKVHFLTDKCKIDLDTCKISVPESKQK